MKKRRVTANAFLDKLHRAGVLVCLGATLWGTTELGLRVWHYYTVVKPNLRQIELQKLQDESATEEGKALQY